MARYQLQLLLSSKLEALAKLILLVRQGRLSLIEANVRQEEPGVFRAELLIDGRVEKIHWLVNKLMFYPYFEKVEPTPIEVS
jgi:hypothetical protein